MYTEKVMDHFQHPRNMGEIENASGVGTVGNAKCGDIMRIYLDIDDNGIINDVKFKTFGCGAAVATSSMATELVKGKHISEAMQVTNKAVMEALDGLPPVKVHCSLLAEEAIMQRCGIMQRSTGSRSKDSRSRRTISVKVKKQKRKSIRIFCRRKENGKKESGSRNVRWCRLIGSGISSKRTGI